MSNFALLISVLFLIAFNKYIGSSISISLFEEWIFFSNIVFDTKDKVNQNFIEYCNTFLPSINMDEITRLLKEKSYKKEKSAETNKKDAKVVAAPAAEKK